MKDINIKLALTFKANSYLYTFRFKIYYSNSSYGKGPRPFRDMTGRYRVMTGKRTGFKNDRDRDRDFEWDFYGYRDRDLNF